MIQCIENLEGFFKNHIVLIFLGAQNPGKGNFIQNCMNLGKKIKQNNTEKALAFFCSRLLVQWDTGGEFWNKEYAMSLGKYKMRQTWDENSSVG